jgi:hypothetical protein
MMILRWAVAATLALTAGAAAAQVSVDPAKPVAIASILDWKDEEQAKGFRNIEHIFKTHTIARGKTVRPLAVAAKQIDPTFTLDGKTWTIDAYMKAYRVSGLLVL